MDKRQQKQERKQQAREYIRKHGFDPEGNNHFNRGLSDRALWLFSQNDCAFHYGVYTLSEYGARVFLKWLAMVEKRHNTLNQQAKQYGAKIYQHFARVYICSVWEFMIHYSYVYPGGWRLGEKW